APPAEMIREATRSINAQGLFDWAHATDESSLVMGAKKDDQYWARHRANCMRTAALGGHAPQTRCFETGQ
ncbi:unnamed protein product, partial [Prorocentrum cordatum]